mgnify:CR=1 FL=1
MIKKTFKFLKSILSKRKLINLDNKIIVFGDSHCRAFSNNENFMPIFTGEGKKHCFINDVTAKNTEKAILSALQNFKNTTSVILYFGEPDTRYYLGKGWKPWETTLNSNLSVGITPEVNVKPFNITFLK